MYEPHLVDISKNESEGPGVRIIEPERSHWRSSIRRALTANLSPYGNPARFFYLADKTASSSQCTAQTLRNSELGVLPDVGRRADFPVLSSLNLVSSCGLWQGF